jgi:DNA-binding beta-propeller fold protein YncE
MKSRSWAVCVPAMLIFMLIQAMGARSDQDGNHRDRDCRDSEHHAHNLKTPLQLVGGILVSGNPLHFDISWVDQETERYFLAEAGNASVDVFDAENDLFLGRIGGFHGSAAQNDPCGRIDGMGPSGVMVTPNNKLWVTDAHGTVRVFDLINAQPPFNLTPIATISTGAQCRADELAFDPKDHLVIVANPAETPPFATLVSSNPPYNVVGKIAFPGAGGLEQSLWDSELHGGRFLVNVPGTGNSGMVAVINPKMMEVETTYTTPSCAGSGLALGPFQHLLVGCGGGQPLLILNALNGTILNTITQIPGADEVWYNSGDGRFYAASNTAPTAVLGVIDAETNTFLQVVPSGPGAHSVSAFRETNHVFVPIGVPTATMPTDTCAAMFGFPAKAGCIAVYAHENEVDEDTNDHNRSESPRTPAREPDAPGL